MSTTTTTTTTPTSPSTRSVEWIASTREVQLIDQRVLPETYALRHYATPSALANAIERMVVRGAPAIGATGAFGMALALRDGTEASTPAIRRARLLEAKRLLDAARPTAVNLAWATRRALRAAAPTYTFSAVLAAALRIAEDDVAINRRMGRVGATVVPKKTSSSTSFTNVLHHCNTGSLATVDRGTALGVIYECHDEAKVSKRNPVHVYVDETRPRLQGARLTAWELMRYGVPLHLIADNAAGSLMRRGAIDVVLVGADRVSRNGDVVNKIGTYKLAVLAKENGVPFYPVVPTSTIDLACATGDEIPIEERDAAEVTFFGERRTAPVDCPVYNPAFDCTPARYVTGIVTEEGLCYPPFEESLRAAKERAEARWEAQGKL